MKKYVAYYRVSTAKQGISGLGLEAQQYAVNAFVKGAAQIVAEYTEVESGKKNNRTQLLLAIAEAKKQKATLLIAKLGRLSRNAAFIFTLRDSGVDFVCADMPDANTLTIGIFAVLAQHERELISSRTKAALQMKKKQGVKLGTPENLTDQARLTSLQVRQQKAITNKNNKRAAALIQVYRQQGFTWLAIAQKLNEAGFKTSRGGMFQAVQVQRIYQQLVTISSFPIPSA
ncbi:recombinase family protein (plasmid) [Adhaeribacter swui]|uniref:Recombinase family protein n=1 Tax=Adhaeribacter swui TaxID=2086471 RepID=A0A7G7G2K0_9BACT|nr:recombinase family protein [Adhaeribacter swui]QNF31384.1 recombinase family protein [Adhaeribacter swui]